MKRALTLILLIPTLLFSQEWEKTYNEGIGHSVIQCTDGGYIVTGTLLTTGINLTEVFLLKTDEDGNVVWLNEFGDMLDDVGYSVKQTTDGGYIICGYTTWYQDFFDVYLIKTDENGDTLWTKHYGGEDGQFGNSVIQNTDGGYVIAGTKDINTYFRNIYLIKTDENGDTLWTKHYGDTLQKDYGASIQQVLGGGYIVAGKTNSNGTDWDLYLLKTDENGNTEWGKNYGNTSIHEQGSSVKQTTDGGFIVTGSSSDISLASSDVYLLKTDEFGDIQWTETYGQNTYNEGHSVQQTIDGGFIITGGTFGMEGPSGLYLIKTNEYGDTLWTRVYENCTQGGNSVQQTADGGYIITGYTGSSNDYYIYLLKTNENGIITSTTEIPVFNPERQLIKLIDITGREIREPRKGVPYIEVYTDGSIRKILNTR